MTGHLELWILGLLVVVAGLVLLANYFRVPYPIFLVLGGLVEPHPRRAQHPVAAGSHLADLPAPLLYSSAFFSSPCDLKANLWLTSSLSIGLGLLAAVVSQRA